MIGYMVRRVISAVLVLITVSLLVFTLFHYGPGDPARAVCPPARCGDPQTLEDIRERMGLDRPMPVQYVDYVKGIFVGRDVKAGGFDIECEAPCFGVSFVYGQSVGEFLWNRLPATISVALGASVVFLLVGVSLGVFAARRRGTMADRLVVGSTLLVNAIPYYLLALLAYLYLISSTGIFPESGYFSPFSEGPVAFIKGMLLPCLVLGLAYSTQYARFSRGAMIEALSEDYVRTARAKGLTERAVTVKHAFRAAIVPIVTLFGLDLAALVAGTIFTERVFGVQGIGVAALDAIGNEDLPIISATVLIAATAVVVMNMIVDILYSVIDPRVRLT